MGGGRTAGGRRRTAQLRRRGAADLAGGRRRRRGSSGRTGSACARAPTYLPTYPRALPTYLPTYLPQKKGGKGLTPCPRRVALMSAQRMRAGIMTAKNVKRSPASKSAQVLMRKGDLSS